MTSVREKEASPRSIISEHLQNELDELRMYVAEHPHEALDAFWHPMAELSHNIRIQVQPTGTCARALATGAWTAPLCSPDTGTDHTVAVTGANGGIGPHVVWTLAQRGVYVRALQRRPNSGIQITAPNIEYVCVPDMTEPAVMGDLLSAVNGVVHLASPTPKNGSPDYNAGSRLTDVLLGACPKDTPIVYASAQSIMTGAGTQKYREFKKAGEEKMRVHGQGNRIVRVPLVPAMPPFDPGNEVRALSQIAVLGNKFKAENPNLIGIVGISRIARHLCDQLISDTELPVPEVQLTMSQLAAMVDDPYKQQETGDPVRDSLIEDLRSAQIALGRVWDNLGIFLTTSVLN